MSSRFCGAKSASLYNFAGQSLHCFIKVRSKVWQLHKFAGQFALQIPKFIQTCWNFFELYKLCETAPFTNCKDKVKTCPICAHPHNLFPLSVHFPEVADHPEAGHNQQYCLPENTCIILLKYIREAICRKIFFSYNNFQGGSIGCFIDGNMYLKFGW